MSFRPGKRVRVKCGQTIPREMWFAEGFILEAATGRWHWVVRLDDHGDALALESALVPIDDAPFLGSWEALRGIWQPPREVRA